jgi:hypothetical protein
MSETAVERLDDEDAAILVGLLVDDPGGLKLHQACANSQRAFLSFRGTVPRYLE